MKKYIYLFNENIDYSQLMEDTFFKYVMQKDDERSEYCRIAFIQSIFNIPAIKTTVLNPITFKEDIDEKDMIINLLVTADTNKLIVKLQQSGYYTVHEAKFSADAMESIVSQISTDDIYNRHVLPVYAANFINEDRYSKDFINQYQLYDVKHDVPFNHNLIYLSLIQMKLVNNISNLGKLNELEKLIYIFYHTPKDIKIYPEEKLIIYMLEMYEEFVKDEEIYAISKNRARAKKEAIQLTKEYSKEREELKKLQDTLHNSQKELINTKKQLDIKMKELEKNHHDLMHNSILLLHQNHVSNELIASSLNITIEEVENNLK